jgi:Ca2+-binding RTX toxin-like protein
VINNGTMSSRSDTIYYTGEARSTIRNTGTILGNLYTIPGGADPGLNIINSGLWDGRLQLTAGDDFINNTGTITSEIDLYDGDNHLDSRYGFVGGDVVAGNGTDIILLGAGDSGIVGGGGGDTIDGGVGFDTVSYVGSAVGVSVNLLTGTAAGGDARGDHLSNIEGLVGTVVRDTLVGDDGANVLNGLIGRDTLTGNGGNDTIQMAGAGPAVIDAGSGNDLIQLQSADASMYGYAFTAATRVQGGTGYDTLEVRQARVMTFTDTTVRGIEHLLMDDGFDYDFTSADATVASGARLLVDGLALSAGNFLHFNGAAETNGHFDFLGGDAKDIFIGGALGDTFTGGVSGDLLTGGAGADTFAYHETSDSKFSLRDHITDFNAAADHLQFDFAVAAVDAPVSGSASTAADLSALASGHMGVGEAILVTVTGGALAGSKLLLVDANGTAGFQGAGDFCIDVTGMTGTLDVGDFVM